MELNYPPKNNTIPTSLELEIQGWYDSFPDGFKPNLTKTAKHFNVSRDTILRILHPEKYEKRMESKKKYRAGGGYSDNIVYNLQAKIRLRQKKLAGLATPAPKTEDERRYIEKEIEHLLLLKQKRIEEVCKQNTDQST